jgi:DHA2 family multidrug resistance protein
MKAPAYIRPWLADWNWGVRITFFLIQISSLMEFSSISLSQNYVMSYLGAQPEDITFGAQLTYAGIITILPVHFRLIRYFETRDYLILFTLFSILLNIAFIFNTDITLFFLIRFLQGIVVGCISGMLLVLIPNFLLPENRQVMAPAIFYSTVLSSGVLLGLIASRVTLNSDFSNLYYYLIAFQVLVMVVILLAFNIHSNIRKYPLYQIDWVGTVFFIMGAVGLAYTLIYGSKLYWFTDLRIRMSALITVAGTFLYISRQCLVKRPQIDISVFKYKKFWIGLILLALYYGSKESINLIFGYTVSVLQWSETQEMILGLCNVAGVIIFMIITSRILIRKKEAFIYFLLAGFSMSLLYHLWMYFLFTPDLAFDDLILPMFFQGAASGILFVPIMVFTLTAVPAETGFSGMVIAAFTRFSSLLNASAGFYNLQLYFNQLYKESFLFHITNVDDQTNERWNGFNQMFLSKGFSEEQAAAGANTSLARVLGMQSQLLTNRATFLFIAGVIAGIVVLILTSLAVKTFNEIRQTKKMSA